MASNFPLLPGFAPTQEFKDHYKKVSARKQEENRDVNKIEPTKYPLPRQPAYQEPVVNNTPFLSTSHDHHNPKNVSKDTSQLYQPDWVALDRHVLRFYGYFKESVVESNRENSRNRKVKVLFYLEDNSVSINEEKFENSGIPQGKFLKREKYVQENGKFLTGYDLRIGQAITLYGRSIYLYNCDDYTREFFEKVNQPQGPAEPYENDQWTTTVTNKWVPKKDAQMKDYLEKKLGGGKVNSEKQFLENDRKVLKFHAKFEGAPFIVHYFLADDTIEVREVALPNSGKDPFPVTFRRQKLPKNFALNQPGQTYAENFVKAEELRVGGDLFVFGRTYALEGCDDFTREYYATKFNIAFPIKPQASGQQAPKSSNYCLIQT